MTDKEKQEEIDRLRAKINGIRRQMVLTESDEVAAAYLEEINGYKEQIHKLNRKPPKVVPIKDAHTVGEKIERKLKGGRRRKSSGRLGTTRVKL